MDAGNAGQLRLPRPEPTDLQVPERHPKRSPILLLLQAAIGVVQDTLIWLLVSWLNSQMYLGLHIDGFLTALLAGTVVRVAVLALLPFGPRPATSTP
ncbi:hypothetical protein N7U49_19605 [Streptomyces sp. AD2-2]|nr:hypothetical protein N7U49_19605 [Streptomyces sp. AD2-2]